MAGEPLTVDQTVSVDWRGPDDIFGATIQATTYTAESRLPVFTLDQLRASSTAYPNWVRRRYLTLPDTVPRRVLTLARDLTATEPTPYDRAKAIEGYLRTFPYTLDLPAPPSDRDIADYFLFELKQGYCDYYATAMVTLARAAGLPARLAVGYIHGSYDAENHRYIVTEAEAHSWVEIYFPEIGWVNFEPTGGRPAIARDPTIAPPSYLTPEEGQSLPALEADPSGFRIQDNIGTLWRGLGLLTGIAGSLAAAIFIVVVIDTWRLSRMSPAVTITVLHQRLYHQAQRLRASFAESNTPYEFAEILAQQIDDLATTQNYWGKYLKFAPHEMRRLTGFYVRTRYSSQQFSQDDRKQVILLWGRLRWRLWLAQILRLFWQEPKQGTNSAHEPGGLKLS